MEPLELNHPLVIRLLAAASCLGVCGMISIGSALVAGRAGSLVCMGVIGGLGMGIALITIVIIDRQL